MINIWFQMVALYRESALPPKVVLKIAMENAINVIECFHLSAFLEVENKRAEHQRAICGIRLWPVERVLGRKQGRQKKTGA